MAETPLFMNQECYGLDLRQYDIEKLRDSGKIQWIIELYNKHPYKENSSTLSSATKARNTPIRI